MSSSSETPIETSAAVEKIRERRPSLMSNLSNIFTQRRSRRLTSTQLVEKPNESKPVLQEITSASDVVADTALKRTKTAPARVEGTTPLVRTESYATTAQLRTQAWSYVLW
jgi:hypothetical protein